MDKFVAYLIPGIFAGAVYAIAASGVVLTYTTTRVFNIAHGAFGMMLAFVFWEFTVSQGIPMGISFILTVFLVAPAIGVIIQRFIARGLGEAPVGVGLVVTVGMFVALLGFTQHQWPAEARTPPTFFPDTKWKVGSTYVTAQQAITVLASVLVAAGLYLLLNKTRIGMAMRASVDNPELLRLFGGRPDNAAALAWAIGISLAALAGILIAPSLFVLDYVTLTLIVVDSYAAAMVGRLKSLPMTFAGAMLLGISSNLIIGYAKPGSTLADVGQVLPSLLLFAAVVLMPQAQLRIGQVKGLVAAPVPTLARSLITGGITLLVAMVLVSGFSEVNLLRMGTAVGFAILMLSLMLLTGYGGHVSLAQLSFAGVGALAYCKLSAHGHGDLYGLIVATLIAAAIGALVALPVLRLTGLYLALATIAFAELMDRVVFQDEKAFGYGGALVADRVSILGTRFESTNSYVLLMCFFLVGVAILLLALRRGAVGRLLIAMRDSPAACGTLGLDQRWFRVGLFALSAGVAGLGGALYAGLRQTIGASDFQFFSGLPLLLLVVVFGVTSVTGSVLGGAGLMLLYTLPEDKQQILFVIIGIGAVFAARDPNGLANLLFKGGRLAENRIVERLMASLPDMPGRRGSGGPGDGGDPVDGDGDGAGAGAGAGDEVQVTPEEVPIHAPA